MKKHKEEIKQSVKSVEEKQSAWRKIQETSKESMKKIIAEQKTDKKEIREEVISVIKQEKWLVRDTVDKVKCLVVFEIPEEKIVNKSERGKGIREGKESISHCNRE